MKSRFTKKRVIIALAAVGVLAIVGVAAAFFTSSGTGSGSATVGSTGNVTIDSVTITGDLFPGGDAATVSYTVNNATGKSVKVGDVVADTGAGTNGITGLPVGTSVAATPRCRTDSSRLAASITATSPMPRNPAPSGSSPSTRAAPLAMRTVTTAGASRRFVRPLTFIPCHSQGTTDAPFQPVVLAHSRSSI